MNISMLVSGNDMFVRMLLKLEEYYNVEFLLVITMKCVVVMK